MRPTLTCHMISSIDGRLLPDRWTPAAESGEPNLILSVYDETAASIGGDGWIVGRATMADLLPPGRDDASAAMTRPDAPDIRALPRRAHVGERDMRKLAIVLDPAGKLDYPSPRIGEEHLVVVLAERIDDRYLLRLRERGISYVFAGGDGHDMHAALLSLRRDFNADSLMLQGGGITNGIFLQHDLIDAISLLVFPGIDGLSGVPSVFECPATQPGLLPALGRRLRLTDSEVRRGGIVWLRYTVERKAGNGHWGPRSAA